MRYGQTLLALLGVSGWAFADEAPIVINPPPDTPVVVNPAESTMPPAPPPVAAPPVAAPLPPTVYEPPPAPPAAPPPAPKPVREHNRWFEPRDTSITAGAGVSDYVGTTMRSATDVGANWDARFTIGQRSLIAFEAGYMGTYNKMDAPQGGSAAPYLMNNSVDTDLRLNLLPFRVQPYVFGGVGYNRATANNLQDSPTLAARFNSSDNQLLVPAGGGLALHLFRHGTIDTRVTYRAIFKEDLDRANPDTRMDQWTVAGRFGYAF